MSSKAKRLGTLADIFQAEKLDGIILKIPIHKILPSKNQPRKNTLVGIEELAESIKKDGLLSPIVVYKEDDYYRIIAGERRFHAVNLLEWKEVECKVISRDEKDYFRIALIENLQREDLSPEEEVEAMLKLKQQENLTDLELSKLISKSRNYVSEILSIAQLPEEIVQKLKELGFYSKNFLVQAAQAYKKGTIENFMQAVSSGEIKTVKEAKTYNKKTIVRQHERNLNRSEKQPHDKEPIQITRNKNIITIVADDIKTAKKIEKWLSNNIKNFNPY